jgi:hypothetical protein
MVKLKLDNINSNYTEPNYSKRDTSIVNCTVSSHLASKKTQYKKPDLASIPVPIRKEAKKNIMDLDFDDFLDEELDNITPMFRDGLDNLNNWVSKK